MAYGRTLLGSHATKVTSAAGSAVLEAPAGWTGPKLDYVKIPVEAECGPQCAGMPMVFASRTASGRRWYRSSGFTRELSCSPGLDIISSTYERDHARWHCEPGGSSVCLRLPPSIVSKYLREENLHFDLQTRFSIQDEVLMDLLFRLANELREDLPNGLLYAEGLCLSALAWLHRHHAVRAAPEPSVGKLSPRQRARLMDFIESHLGEELSVEQMAAAAGLSISHFSVLFRQSFGVPPHRYVLQQRLDRAAQLLRNEPRRSITDVAVSLGFSSQAHLSSAFKCHTGQSPSQWRSNWTAAGRG